MIPSTITVASVPEWLRVIGTVDDAAGVLIMDASVGDPFDATSFNHTQRCFNSPLRIQEFMRSTRVASALVFDLGHSLVHETQWELLISFFQRREAFNGDTSISPRRATRFGLVPGCVSSARSHVTPHKTSPADACH